MITTNQRERIIIASVIDSPNQELPPTIKAIIQTAPEGFDDLRHRAVATAIKQSITNGHAPDFAEIGKHLGSEHFSFIASLNHDALPLALAEIEAAPLLRDIEARRVTGTLAEALQVAKENPGKAAIVAKTAAAALQSLTPETQAERCKKWPKPLGEDAYIGLAGDFVGVVEAHTESDPAALMFQFLVCFGNCTGTNSFYRQEWTAHNAREFVLIVGKSAKARKGTSWNIVKEIFRLADENWSKKRIVGGLGSGEGVVNCVRDPQTERNEQGQETTIAGVDDKRLMVVESEFASVLSVSGRDGSTLSEVLRNAWDSGNIQTLTKNNPLRATNAHISVIGHITETELNKKLGDNAIFNGFANRFLVVCAKRVRLLPDGGTLTDEDFQKIAGELARVIDAARKISRLTRSAEARKLWHEVYPLLSGDRPGSFGAITSRAEAHVLRLSIIYALLDGSSEIQLAHLKAALECWRYCQDSALYIWGDFTGGLAGKIRDALAQAGQGGLTRSQLYDALGGRITAEEFEPELTKLISSGEVTSEQKPTRGRTAIIYKLRIQK